MAMAMARARAGAARLPSLKRLRGSVSGTRTSAEGHQRLLRTRFGWGTGNAWRGQSASSGRRRLWSEGRKLVAEVKASAAADDAQPAGRELGRRVVLGGLFGLWYAFNVVFNVYNKKVLMAYPYPAWMTLVQFATGSVMALAMWGGGAHRRPEVTWRTVKAVLPLAGVHTLGNLLTNVSLGKVAVSFTHTIKALEPFFSVVLSVLFLGDRPSPMLLSSLAPIVGGVALASATEATFNWAGFLSAMGSNLTFQSRNVLSKLLMGGKKPMDNINLFSLITILSVPLTLPFAVGLEGFGAFTPSSIESHGLSPTSILPKSIIAGFCFHMYQQVSYMILQRVVPVTHSVGNCIKRVIIIASSVAIFQNPINLANGAGTGIALIGVFLYSHVRLSHWLPLCAALLIPSHSRLTAGEALRESQMNSLLYMHVPL